MILDLIHFREKDNYSKYVFITLSFRCQDWINFCRLVFGFQYLTKPINYEMSEYIPHTCNGRYQTKETCIVKASLLSHCIIIHIKKNLSATIYTVMLFFHIMWINQHRVSEIWENTTTPHIIRLHSNTYSNIK